MDRLEKQVLHQQRQATALKNSMFNRYLLLRYSLATFFFANIYWVLIGLTNESWVIIVPSVLIILNVKACIEQFKLYGTEEVLLESTKSYLHIQTYVNLLLMILIWTNNFTNIFPILANNLTSKIFSFAILSVGLSILLLNLRRITQIYNNTDKAYKYLYQMKKNMDKI